MAAAHELARSGGARVTVYEKENYLGGHARTMAVEDAAGTL
jgi:cyclopropane-fatty-acyl-phospholipid synthase